MRTSIWAVMAGVLLGSFAATSVWAEKPNVDEVNCGKGKKIQDTVDKVRNGKPNTDYVINVTGACVEDVSILNLLSDSLVIDGGGTASITGTGSLPAVISVSGARQVTIRGFRIEGTQSGLSFEDCQFCSLHESSVLVSPTTGGKFGVAYGNPSIGAVTNSKIEVWTTAGGNTGISALPRSNVFIAGTAIQRTGGGSPDGAGVVLGYGAVVNITNYQGQGGLPFVTTTISGFRRGVSVTPGAVVSLFGPGPIGPGDGVVIENNVTGIDVVGARANLTGRVKVRNNTGSFVTGSDVDGGISVSQNGQLALAGNGVEITGNAGYGISATHGSYVEMGISGTSSISNNAKKGLVLEALSIGKIKGGLASAAISGNLGGDQVACDASSVLTGTSNLNLAGGTINCPNSTQWAHQLP